jgi:hypothetical protein
VCARASVSTGPRMALTAGDRHIFNWIEGWVYPLAARDFENLSAAQMGRPVLESGFARKSARHVWRPRPISEWLVFFFKLALPPHGNDQNCISVGWQSPFLGGEIPFRCERRNLISRRLRCHPKLPRHTSSPTQKSILLRLKYRTI